MFVGIAGGIVCSLVIGNVGPIVQAGEVIKHQSIHGRCYYFFLFLLHSLTQGCSYATAANGGEVTLKAAHNIIFHDYVEYLLAVNAQNDCNLIGCRIHVVHTEGNLLLLAVLQIVSKFLNNTTVLGSPVLIFHFVFLQADQHALIIAPRHLVGIQYEAKATPTGACVFLLVGEGKYGVLKSLVFVAVKLISRAGNSYSAVLKLNGCVCGRRPAIFVRYQFICVYSVEYRIGNICHFRNGKVIEVCSQGICTVISLYKELYGIPRSLALQVSCVLLDHVAIHIHIDGSGLRINHDLDLMNLIINYGIRSAPLSLYLALCKAGGNCPLGTVLQFKACLKIRANIAADLKVKLEGELFGVVDASVILEEHIVLTAGIQLDFQLFVGIDGARIVCGLVIGNIDPIVQTGEVIKHQRTRRRCYYFSLFFLLRLHFRNAKVIDVCSQGICAVISLYKQLNGIPGSLALQVSSAQLDHVAIYVHIDSSGLWVDHELDLMELIVNYGIRTAPLCFYFTLYKAGSNRPLVTVLQFKASLKIRVYITADFKIKFEGELLRIVDSVAILEEHIVLASCIQLDFQLFVGIDAASIIFGLVEGSISPIVQVGEIICDGNTGFFNFFPVQSTQRTRNFKTSADQTDLGQIICFESRNVIKNDRIFFNCKVTVLNANRAILVDCVILIIDVCKSNLCQSVTIAVLQRVVCINLIYYILFPINCLNTLVNINNHIICNYIIFTDISFD